MRGLDFWIDASEESRHLMVTLEFDPAACGPGTDRRCTLFLPTWTPGSYLLREYSRHLSRVRATDAVTGEELRCIKTRKNRSSSTCCRRRSVSASPTASTRTT